MALPRACLFWYPTCPMTLIVYKQVISLLKYKLVVGTQQVPDLTSKQTLVSPFIWVTFTDDLWETDKWPRQVQVLCSHDLPNISKCYICRMYKLWDRWFKCGFYPLLPALRHRHYVSFLFSIAFEFCNFGLSLVKSLVGDWLILRGAGTDRWEQRPLFSVVSPRACPRVDYRACRRDVTPRRLRPT